VTVGALHSPLARADPNRRPAALARPTRPETPRSQYPFPPELLEWLGAGAAAPPEAVTSCHTPPEMFRLFPLAWPGALSPVYVYRGCPL
jgi:hypothetical protein